MTKRVSSAVIGAILGGTLIAAGFGGGYALQRYLAPPERNFLHTGEAAPRMQGWADFCNRAEGNCLLEGGYETVRLTPQLLKIMQWITTDLRQQTGYRFDDPGKDVWGPLVEGGGDCEDFAITARSLLEAAGVPKRAMPLTIVDGPPNAAPNPKAPNQKSVHAILTVRTDQGDYIIDQVRLGTRLWYETGYIFHRMESFDEVGFRSLGDVAGLQPVAPPKATPTTAPAGKTDRLPAISRR